MSVSKCVGMGEIAVTADQNVELTCLGLGSCIAICAYAARRHVGGMVHVVLPTAAGPDAVPPGKYADTAVPLLLQELRRLGVRKDDIRLVLCGGAAVFAGLSGLMDIGQRNIAAVHAALQSAGLPVQREDLGGRDSRTVSLNVATGIVRLRTVRTGECVFAELQHG